MKVAGLWVITTHSPRDHRIHRDLHAYLHEDGIGGTWFCCAFTVPARLLPEELQTCAVLADRA